MSRLILFLSLFLATLVFAEDGKITFLIGSVEVQPKGESIWKKAYINRKIANGDRIRTRLQSRCELKLPDESSIKIQENTVFEVKIIDAEKEEEFSFFLWLGNISAKFKKIVSSRQSRTIESPSAVVAVRGTEFSVGVDQSKMTKVRVKSGSVEYTSKGTGRSVMVGTNQFSTVSPGHDPTPPQQDDQDGGQDQGAIEGQGDTEDESLTLDIQLTTYVFKEPMILSQGLAVKGTTLPGTQIKAGSAVGIADASGKFQLNVQVVEGLNSITVSARNKDQTTSSIIRIFVNTKLPFISVRRPVNSRFVKQNRYDLEGSINDLTPMDQVELYVNNKRVGKFAAKASFRIPLILKEGLNEFTVIAKDRSGNVQQFNESIFLDSVKPQIAVTRPATSGLVINLPPNPPTSLQRPKTIIVVGRVLDPQPSSGLEKVSVNGVSIQLSPNGQFELPIKLHIGSNNILFIGMDRAGNEKRVSRTILVRRGNQ